MLKDDLEAFVSEYPEICEIIWRTVPAISVAQKYNFYY